MTVGLHSVLVAASKNICIVPFADIRGDEFFSSPDTSTRVCGSDRICVNPFICVSVGSAANFVEFLLNAAAVF